MSVSFAESEREEEKRKSTRRLNSVIHEAMLSEGKYPFVLPLYIISLFLLMSPTPFYLWPLADFATAILRGASCDLLGSLLVPSVRNEPVLSVDQSEEAI